MSNYKSKAKISSIRATSRASVKVKDNYYTVEYTEERLIPDSEDIDMDLERKILWDTVNTECDNQIEDILTMYTKK